MSNRLLIVTAGIAASLATSGANAQFKTFRADRPGQFGRDGSFIPFVATPGEVEFSGMLIVRPVQDLGAGRDAAARALLAGLSLRHHPKTDEYIVSVPGAGGRASNGAGENALAQRLMATGLFQYAVPNWVCYPLLTPNDTFYPNQWHHPQMESAAGWDISTGESSIIVAFTDTGIYKNHVDLAGKVVNGYDAYNNISEDDGGSVADIHGHGTHVAGCAAAITNNATGVAGVNWNARIMMIRVAIDGSGGAYYEDLLEGAQWAIEHGAKIVSASYSGIGYDPIQTTGEYIHSIGGIYMYAAGNDSRNLSWFDFQDVVIVGASTYNDDPAWFTAYGTAVDVFAPGVDIGSTTMDGGYGWWSGTSMATPVANGVASLIWNIAPNLTPQEVEQILFQSCTDLGDPGEDSFWGWGRVNVRQAAEDALDASCLADWNGDGSVNTVDVIAFLNDWAAGDANADLNGDGSVNTIDVVAFLNAWAGGC